jgi:lysosomal acid lipase/cholesteryl ester hydrolase
MLEVALKSLNQWELLPRGSVPTQYIPGGVGFKLLEKFIAPLYGGEGSFTFNISRLPLYLSHYPAGASLYTLLHLAQFIDTGRFQHFDHGPVGNLIHYGSRVPSLFHPERVTVPVIISASTNDKLAIYQDVQHLTEILPNVVANITANFSHPDFMWGLDAREKVWDKIMLEMVRL